MRSKTFESLKTLTPTVVGTLGGLIFGIISAPGFGDMAEEMEKLSCEKKSVQVQNCIKGIKEKIATRIKIISIGIGFLGGGIGSIVFYRQRKKENENSKLDRVYIPQKPPNIDF